MLNIHKYVYNVRNSEEKPFLKLRFPLVPYLYQYPHPRSSSSPWSCPLLGQGFAQAGGAVAGVYWVVRLYP